MPPRIQQFDVNQPVQNYFTARRQGRQEARRDVLAGQQQQTFQNAMTDRTRRIGREDVTRGREDIRWTQEQADKKRQDLIATEDREFQGKLKKIKADKTISAEAEKLLMEIDPSAQDFQEQIFDSMTKFTGVLQNAGYSEGDIKRYVDYSFGQGFAQPENIAKAQESLRGKLAKKRGAMERKGLSAEMKDLTYLLGRKPTMEENKAFKESKSTKKTIPLKTGESATLDDLRKAYITSYGKTDSSGFTIFDVSRPNFQGWVNDQAVSPFFSNAGEPDATFKEATERATKEASDKAGYLSTDKTDFGKAGRAAWITNRALEIMGGPSQEDTAPPPAEAQPPQEIPTTPPGKVLVYDTNGNPGFIPAEQLPEALSQGYTQAQ